MRNTRWFIALLVSGMVIFTTVHRAHAMDPYTQGLVTQMLSGLMLGAPTAPYGRVPYSSYPLPGYGPYGPPPAYGPYGLGGHGYGSPYQSGHRYDYGRAMRRLDRQEAQAMANAARRSYGNPGRYNERMAKIERKYAYKRDKVERNPRYFGY